jgi:outer membrane protein TolC
VQARAALLPTVNGFSQYIYTQGNGTPTGIFVPNDRVHVYNDYITTQADLYSLAKRADYRRAIAAEYGAQPAGQKGRPPAIPDSFHVLIVGK